MALTGTLATFGSEDTWRVRYQNEVIKVLETGGGDILGVPIPIPLPLEELAPSQAESVKKIIADGENLKVMEDSFYKTVETIDTILPPGPNSGIQDPTVPIKPVIPIFLDILVQIGIPDPLSWILENLEAFSELPWDKLASCQNEEFAAALVAIDDSINPDGLPAKLDAVCGFSLPSINVPFPPTIELPSFGFDFALGGIDFPSFDPLIDFNIDLPSINWFSIQFMLGLIDGLKQLLLKIADLVLELLKGILDFLIAIIEFIIGIIMAAIEAIMAVLGQCILFVAEVIAFIKLAIVSFATAFIGFMVNKGVIAFGAGRLLGLA